MIINPYLMMAKKLPSIYPLPWPFWRPLGFQDAPEHYRRIAGDAGLTDLDIKRSAHRLWADVLKDAKRAYRGELTDPWRRRYDDWAFLTSDPWDKARRLFPGLGLALGAFAVYYACSNFLGDDGDHHKSA
jgi:hypothetical protein